MSSEKLLYNSRVFNNYIRYLKKFYPNINVDDLLSKAGMSIAQVNDHGCWFSQKQADLFQKTLVSLTGDSSISRNAGRFAASLEAMGFLKAYALGLLYPLRIYLSLNRLHKNMTRGSELDTLKLGRNKVEVIARTFPDTPEKEYQCQNRMGLLESIPKLLTRKYANIEHPECMHKGAEQCRYIISWKDSMSTDLMIIRNYSAILGPIAVLLFWIFSSTGMAITGSAIFGVYFASIFCFSTSTEKKELKAIIQKQGDAAGALLQEANLKYQYSLLLESIARTLTGIRDPQGLNKNLMQLLDKNLDFDRGLLMLWDKNRQYLEFAANFGHNKKEIHRLKSIRFGIIEINENVFFKTVITEKKPVLISRVRNYHFSKGIKDILDFLKVHSAICAPLVYEETTLGILAVDISSDRKSLTQSDLSLLTAVSSQFALSIANVTSFKQLTESENRYRSLFENIPLGILTCDPTGKIRDFNPMLLKTLHFDSGSQLKSTNIFTDRWFSQTGIATDIMECLKNRQSAIYEKRVQISSYEVIHIRYHVDPNLNEREQVYRIQTIFEDITEKKQIETHLQQSQKMESIGTLAGGIAHDFNNILTAIIGYTELAVANITRKASALAKLNQVLLAANRAKNLIHQILTFSRQTDLELKPVQINLIIKEVVKMLRATLPKGVSLTFNPGSDVMVMADPTQIHQIIMNLCTNSIQAVGPQGGNITIILKEVLLTESDTEVIPETESGPYVLISVKDDGLGIDPQIIERIFEPFFTSKKRGKGTGMGLAVVHGIVRSLNGAITVNSSPGNGARFDVYLPRIEKIIPYDPDEFASLPAGTEQILLIMSDSNFLNLYNEMLTKLGYQVTTAALPQEGIIRIRQKDQSFQLIIFDTEINHPDLDVFIASINEESGNLPIVLCGSTEHTKSEVKLHKMGIRTFLAKPHTFEQLAICIREALD